MRRKNSLKKITVAGLCFAFSMGLANAQQLFSANWSTYVGGEVDPDSVHAIVCDSQTNLYVGGFLGQGAILHDPTISPIIGYIGAQDGFVAHITNHGELDWYTCIGGTKNDCILGVALSTNGTVYAAGVSDGVEETDIGTHAILSAFDSTSGSVKAGCWPVSLGDPNTTNGFNAVTVDAAGYIYAVGYTTQTNLTAYGIAHPGSTDALVTKYAPDGTQVWARYLGGTNADVASAVALSSDGSLYVGGTTCSPGWSPLASGTPSPSNPDAFLVKLTTNGVPVWSTLLGGTAADALTALVKDPSSSVLFLGGTTASTNFLPLNVCSNALLGKTDGFVVKLTDNGTAFQTNWCRFFGGSTTDSVSSLTLLPSGNLVVGGTTDSGTWLTKTTSSVFGGVQDGFLSMLSGDGLVVWSSYVGGERNDELHAITSVSSALLTVGSTFSTNWISGGFEETWSKLENIEGVGDAGFVATWTSEPPTAPAVTADPQDVTANEGASATFRITATGSTPLTYRWFRNGVPLANNTSNAYFIAAVAPTNNNDTYACLVSNYCGTATSQVARLTVLVKGTLTVTLSPPQAIAQGAKWSANSGTNWLASGVSTNLLPGAYTVTFTNLTGWTTPVALSNLLIASSTTLSTSGVYTAILPSASRAISGTNVTVTVQAPAGLSQWTLIETLAAGLTPTAYTSGGTWSNATHTLTFTGPAAFTNTLSYTVSAQTSGAYTVSGTITPSPVNIAVAVTGDTRILSANFIRIINGQSVTIMVTQPSASVIWAAQEYMPSGLIYTNATGPISAEFSDDTVIYWTKRSSSTNLTYQVIGNPGTYTLSGVGQIGTAGWQPIFGDTVLTIADTTGGSDTNVPPPNILYFVPVDSTTYALAFTSVVSKTYLILTNATVGNTNGWATCLSLSGQAGTTQQQVPANGSNLFYRVRLQQ